MFVHVLGFAQMSQKIVFECYLHYMTMCCFCVQHKYEFN